MTEAFRLIVIILCIMGILWLLQKKQGFSLWIPIVLLLQQGTSSLLWEILKIKQRNSMEPSSIISLSECIRICDFLGEVLIFVACIAVILIIRKDKRDKGTV